MLNKKWRAVSKEELRRMPLGELDDVIESVDDWTKNDINRIWEHKRAAFEVY